MPIAYVFALVRVSVCVCKIRARQQTTMGDCVCQATAQFGNSIGIIINLSVFDYFG